MYIYKRKLKSDTVYYLCKSYCDPNTGKNSSKIVERIGTLSELKGKHKDLDASLKKYAKEKTAQENQKHSVYSINFDSGKRLNRKEVHRFNAGYFILQKICYKLGINKICDEIAKEAGYKSDIKTSMKVIKLDIFTDKNGIPLGYLNNSSEKANSETRERIINALKYW